MSRLRRCAVTGALAGVLAAGAETAPSSVDLSVPDSPAFTVLGVTPTQVTRPSTAKDLAASLLNGLDQDGNFQTGIALDMIPYLLAIQSHITVQQYTASYATRFLARASVSLGTTKGVTGDRSTKLASGLRLTLFDKGDPRGDKELAACFNQAFQTWVDNHPNPQIISDVEEPALKDAQQKLAGFKDSPAESDAALAARMSAKLEVLTLQQKIEADRRADDAADTKRNADYAKCVDDARRNDATRSAWIIAAAPSWASPDGLNSDMRWDGGAAWTSLAYGFEGVPGLEKTTQLMFHGRYRQHELVQIPETGIYLRQDTGVAGVQLRVGNPNVTVAVEGAFIHRQPKGLPVDNSFQTTISADAKVADGLWFNLAVGTESGRQNMQNRVFILSQFQWGFSKNAPMAK